MTEIVALFITTSSLEEARKVARALLGARLAACVNIVPGVESHYWWEGQLEEASECLLVVKTRRGQVAALVEAVKKEHSYSVPEVVALPVLDGNADYLEWVRAQTRQG